MSIFWKFVHDAIIHPLMAGPWKEDPQWVNDAHDYTVEKGWGVSYNTKEDQGKLFEDLPVNFFWKFVHNAVIHPLTSGPWNIEWLNQAHDRTAELAWPEG